MSIVIVGGNDCMVRQYKDLCEKYACRAKVFTQVPKGFRDKIGTPDIMVLFTHTVSHKMVQSALIVLTPCVTFWKNMPAKGLSSTKYM